MDWFGLLAVQGILKSLLQHQNSKASVLWHSAFFTVQLSHPYMTTGKTIALTEGTLVSKVMSLLLNMLSRLVITGLGKRAAQIVYPTRSRGLQPTRLLCSWDSSGRNTGRGCHFFLQEIFLTQELNPGLPHCRQMLYPLSYQGSPRSSEEAHIKLKSQLRDTFSQAQLNTSSICTRKEL